MEETKAVAMAVQDMLSVYNIRHTSMSIMNILRKEWLTHNISGSSYPSTVEDLDEMVKKTRELLTCVPKARMCNPMEVSIIDDYENIKSIYNFVRTVNAHDSHILNNLIGRAAQLEEKSIKLQEKYSLAEEFMKKYT